jgi:hypothetical protein
MTLGSPLSTVEIHVSIAMPHTNSHRRVAVFQSVISGQPADFNKYMVDVLALEQKWGGEKKVYPSTPQGDTVATSKALLHKYTDNDSDYITYQGKDVNAGDCNLYQAWTNDLAMLRNLCDMDDACTGGWRGANGSARESSAEPDRCLVLTHLFACMCALSGFNMNGYMKNSTDISPDLPTTTLYMKKSAMASF